MYCADVARTNAHVGIGRQPVVPKYQHLVWPYVTYLGADRRPFVLALPSAKGCLSTIYAEQCIHHSVCLKHTSQLQRYHSKRFFHRNWHQCVSACHHKSAFFKQSVDMASNAVKLLYKSQRAKHLCWPLPLTSTDDRYAIGKQIQWTWSNIHGADTILTVGRLRIEIIAPKNALHVMCLEEVGGPRHWYKHILYYAVLLILACITHCSGSEYGHNMVSQSPQSARCTRWDIHTNSTVATSENCPASMTNPQHLMERPYHKCWSLETGKYYVQHTLTASQLCWLDISPVCMNDSRHIKTALNGDLGDYWTKSVQVCHSKSKEPNWRKVITKVPTLSQSPPWPSRCFCTYWLLYQLRQMYCSWDLNNPPQTSKT